MQFINYKLKTTYQNRKEIFVKDMYIKGHKKLEPYGTRYNTKKIDVV